MSCGICGLPGCTYSSYTFPAAALYPTYTPYTYTTSTKFPYTTSTEGDSMSSLAKDDHVKVEFKGKVVDPKTVAEFFRTDSFGSSGENWTGITDDETGVIHLLWKYSNPAKVTEPAKPANWPPQNHDVWKIGAYTWHAFSDGKLRTSTGSYNYDAKEVLNGHGSGKAELLYRKAS